MSKKIKSRYGNIIIFGCGGHARSVADIILSNNKSVGLIFVDKEAKENEKIFGFKVVRDFNVNDKEKYGCIIGIGDNNKRKELYEKIIRVKNLEILTVISKKSYIGYNAKIGKGCVVGNYSHIGPEVEVGEDTILNNGCVVDHEVKVGKHSHIGPNVTISGRSKIGDLVFIGVGATVIDKVKICSNVIVGAGATVISDITEPGTYVGTPARKVK